jgi:DNA uptake protein ComE-like DNA-binding protein
MATYPNRTDLNNPTKKLAVTTAPGQTYGEAGAQRAAQQAVPMGSTTSHRQQQLNVNAQDKLHR